MRYINPRFTYLLTYLLTYLHTYLHKEQLYVIATSVQVPVLWQSVS